nr:MAG TPA: hypothetical protein [Inoviridae sp.]
MINTRVGRKRRRGAHRVGRCLPGLRIGPYLIGPCIRIVRRRHCRGRHRTAHQYHRTRIARPIQAQRQRSQIDIRIRLRIAPASRPQIGERRRCGRNSRLDLRIRRRHRSSSRRIARYIHAPDITTRHTRTSTIAAPRRRQIRITGPLYDPLRIASGRT